MSVIRSPTVKGDASLLLAGSFFFSSSFFSLLASNRAGAAACTWLLFAVPHIPALFLESLGQTVVPGRALIGSEVSWAKSQVCMYLHYYIGERRR